MHYSNLVIIKKTEYIEPAVKKAMGANEDQGGFWDWYQIGGRWTGALDGYDPWKDPANIESCDLCHGTGFRRDGISDDPTYTCNGCGTYDSEAKVWTHGKHGPGRRVKWPSRWVKHQGDIAPIESLTDEIYDRFHRIVTPYCRVFGGEEYLPWKPSGEVFRDRERPPLNWLKKEYAGYLVVVVDNHS